MSNPYRDLPPKTDDAEEVDFRRVYTAPVPLLGLTFIALAGVGALPVLAAASDEKAAWLALPIIVLAIAVLVVGMIASDRAQDAAGQCSRSRSSLTGVDQSRSQ
jgi:hypothetical protein